MIPEESFQNVLKAAMGANHAYSSAITLYMNLGGIYFSGKPYHVKNGRSCACRLFINQRLRACNHYSNALGVGMAYIKIRDNLSFSFNEVYP